MMLYGLVTRTYNKEGDGLTRQDRKSGLALVAHEVADYPTLSNEAQIRTNRIDQGSFYVAVGDRGRIS